MSATPSSPDEALVAGLALAQVERLGGLRFREYVERHGSAATAFPAVVPSGERVHLLDRARAILDRALRHGVHVFVYGEPGYPEQLTELEHPPSVVYVLGHPEALLAPMVSIVGTRRSSEAGERVARRFAAALAEHGGVVVSGMALGIDGAAHRGALDVGGRTIAVLAGGVDIPHPPSHRALYRQILERGAVISEAPPGSPAFAGGFPRRNRIIAALGRATIVVEAGDKSGASITAKYTMEMNRGLGAVPGWIDSPRSIGTNQLLRNGAQVLLDVRDVLVLAGFAKPGEKPNGVFSVADSAASESIAGATATTASCAVHRQLDAPARAVLRALESGAGSLEEVERYTGLPAREVGVAIIALELAGAVWSDHVGGVRLAR